MSRDGNIPHIHGENTGESFTICINIYRIRIGASWKNKLVGPNRVSGEFLKLGAGAEFTIPYLARLLDITMNNSTLPGDWKRAKVIPFHKGVIIIIHEL